MNNKNLSKIIFTTEIDQKQYKGFCPINVEQGYSYTKNTPSIDAVQITKKPAKRNKKEHTFEPVLPQFFTNINLTVIEKIRTFGHYSMFSGIDPHNRRKLVVAFKRKTIAEIPCDFSYFVYFKGSVPLSIAVVTQSHSRFATNRAKLPKDDLPSPRELRLHWFYDGGESGLLSLKGVDDLKSGIVGVFKIQLSMLLVILEDKNAYVYGKSYNLSGAYQTNMLTSTDLNRDFSPSDRLMEACCCLKQLVGIKYKTKYEDEDFDRTYILVFRISKLSKLMKIADSHEEYPEFNLPKFFLRIFPVRNPGERDQDGFYKVQGYFLRFITYTKNKEVCLNFWRLNQWGGFDGVFHKFVIAKLSEKEAGPLLSGKALDLSRLDETKEGGVSKTKDSIGCLFCWIYHSNRIIRVVYDPLKLFQMYRSEEADITDTAVTNDQLEVIKKTLVINDKELKEVDKEDNFIPIIDLDFARDDVVNVQLNRNVSHQSQKSGKDPRDFQYYENHEKVLGDYKALTPLFTRDRSNSRRYSQEVGQVRKNSMGGLKVKERYLRGDSSAYSIQNSRTSFSKMAGELEGGEDEKKVKDNACCQLI